MKRIAYILILLLIFVVAGCGKQRFFKIKGEITGLGPRTVTMFYYSSGGLQCVSANGDGSGGFELRGESVNPTLVVVALGDGTVLANLVAQNGNNISLQGDIDHPMAIEVKGSGVSSEIAEWQKEHESVLSANNDAAVNAAVKSFVESNKGSMAAAAILVTHFRTPGYETLADSLMSIIKTDGRPGGVVQNFSAVLARQLSSKTLASVKPMLLNTPDTSCYFMPTAHRLSLLAFLPEVTACRDSIVPRLADLRDKYDEKQFEMVEISSALDSARWRESIRTDSAKWKQTWAPASMSGASVRALSVPRVPYFIVADSAGNQLLRTHSVKLASSLVLDILK